MTSSTQILPPLLIVVLFGMSQVTTGCVTRTKANADVQAAYQAGQQEAFRRMQQARGPSVTVAGPVRIPFVTWEQGLTLARTLVDADYYGPEPREIVIIRNGEEIKVDVSALLGGQDVPLQAGDTVKITP